MHDFVTETVDGPLPAIGLPAALQAGTVLDGRYRIERLLGHGGSAMVYAARDLKLNQDVALKMLRADRLTQTAVKRLRREVATARTVSDPRLVRMFDIIESDQGTYLTMELFDAPTLGMWMSGRRLAIEEVVQIASEILSALGALHAAQIIHRDLKPTNVLIDDGGRVKLGDFGLALHLQSGESRLTQTASLVGTFEYLSPEQALGRNVDARSDLYSLGVLLFEMLTGELPFETESSVAAAVAHVNRQAPNVRKLRRDTPRWLARV
ncbi:MAG TPA: serine/threonine-protein kinase, partial [Thermoanaerobaculia bacterium]|nr:serine/threonine-protein kinase [Thermoanaerobaculia bacterium]